MSAARTAATAARLTRPATVNMIRQTKPAMELQTELVVHDINDGAVLAGFSRREHARPRTG
ncbi:hypothetical protein BN2476_300075 [Paraburkholderia piptadeniae]|uniref:Uncharacterized protein n=1 Tax=Paraburkholderia piptadeniae TaxID=1701573 RepID=A0A1N7S3M1_9BURK|nr:hypothetical protein BN2476_300075 [Paraburkholderia piptadeniae]